MLDNLIPLIAAFLDLDWLAMWFFPLLAGYVVISVPALIRALTKWR